MLLSGRVLKLNHVEMKQHSAGWDGEGFLSFTDKSGASFLQGVMDSPGGW